MIRSTRILPAMVMACAAIVLSPVASVTAAPVIIDSFTTASSPNPITVHGSVDASAHVATTTSSFSGGAYNLRYNDPQFTVGTSATVPNFTVQSIYDTSGGGSLTSSLSMTESGPINTAYADNTLTYVGSNLGLLDFTAGGNNVFRVAKSAGFAFGDTAALKASILLYDLDNNFAFFTPSNAAWFSAGTLDVPYSSFTVDPEFNWTSVSEVDLFNRWNEGGSLATGGAFSASVTLTEISLVPEPAAMAIVGVATAAASARHLARRRRSRA